MKKLFVLQVVIGVMSLLSCRQPQQSPADRTAMANCRGELNAIRGLEPLLRNRNKQPQAETGAPFEGLQLALTINGNIQRNAQEDDDDSCANQNSQTNFERLLAALRGHQMPPTVNFIAGRFLDEALARRWLEQGNLIGSLTYGRKRARHNSVGGFLEDLARSEETFASLWRDYPPERKYFRFPRLKESADPQTREEIRSHLNKSDYVVVAGTIDSRDWRFAQLYCAAQSRGDQTCASFVRQCYYTLLFDSTSKARAAATAIAGREIKHILMIEANQFTADTLAETLGWYKRLGAKFISLDEALADPVYTSLGPDRESLAMAVFREVKRLQTGSVEEE